MQLLSNIHSAAVQYAQYRKKRMEQGPKFNSHHVKIMKVALALAIIRSKPKGVNGEEYAQRLAHQFSQLQTNWRERASHLERELLRTRQEMLGLQVNSELTVGRELGGVYSQTDSTQSTDSQWVSSGYSSSTQTQDDLSEMFKLKTKITWQQEKEAGPPPMSDLSNHDGSQSDCGRDVGVEDLLRERIRGHVKFCCSVSTLVCLQGQLSDLLTFDLRSNLHETLMDAIKGLTESLKCRVLVSSSATSELFVSAATSIVDCLQLPLLAPVLSDLTEATCSLSSSLIECIVNQHSSSSLLCSVLMTLCGLPLVLHHTLRETVKEMARCADNLKASVEDVFHLDISLVEGVGNLSHALDEVLTKYGTDALSDKECAQYQEELEASVIGLIDIFPLFCYSVWRLIAHLPQLEHTTY